MNLFKCNTTTNNIQNEDNHSGELFIPLVMLIFIIDTGVQIQYLLYEEVINLKSNHDLFRRRR